MYKKIFYRGFASVCGLIALLRVSYAQECPVGHTMSGTAYGEAGVKQYASMKHGPDGALFLDPYFLPFIENMEGQVILDAGCGTAPWAIYAAKNGAYAYGIDIQESMIRIGNQEVLKTGLENRVRLEVGDVNNLPFSNAFFDKAISINVGCNLPSAKIIDDGQKEVGLGMHFVELARVLKEKGRVVITAPGSLDVVFTTGKRKLSEILEDIEEALSKIDGDDSSSIMKYLGSLNDVYRATFVNNNGKLKLVTNVNDLKNGENIWRKIPGMIVPNVYHSEDEYISEAIKAGFNIVKIERPQLNDEIELISYNERHSEAFRLGNAYIRNNAFIIIELEKV